MFNREYIFNKVHFPASYVSLLVGNPVMMGFDGFFDKLNRTPTDFSVLRKNKTCLKHPRKQQGWIPNITPYLEGDTFRKPSFLVSMLDFGVYNVFRAVCFGDSPWQGGGENSSKKSPR